MVEVGGTFSSELDVLLLVVTNGDVGCPRTKSVCVSWQKQHHGEHLWTRMSAAWSTG